MCQLNLYFVPKTVDKDKAIEIFNNTFDTKICECVTDENIVKGYKNYNVYICAGMRCNCGSVIGSLQDRKTYDSWEFVKEESIKAQLEEFNAIKDLLEQKDYKKKFDEVSKKQKELFELYNKVGSDVGAIERKLIAEVEDRTDLTLEEKSKILHEEVYPKIQEMLTERENLPNRQEALKNYQNFMQENKLMISSGFYSLTRPESPTTKEIVVREDGTKEEVEFLNFSNCIYDMIENIKNPSNDVEKVEFENLKNAVKEFLKICDDVKILAFWQDEDEVAVNDEIEYSFDEFNIESIAYLKYKDLLTITK